VVVRAGQDQYRARRPAAWLPAGVALSGSVDEVSEHDLDGKRPLGTEHAATTELNFVAALDQAQGQQRELRRDDDPLRGHAPTVSFQAYGTTSPRFRSPPRHTEATRASS
jgi:hypothetical protein